MARKLAQLRMVATSLCCSGPRGISESATAEATIPPIGLRISWLMLATNSVFAALAFSSSSVRRRTISSSASARRLSDLVGSAGGRGIRSRRQGRRRPGPGRCPPGGIDAEAQEGGLADLARVRDHPDPEVVAPLPEPRKVPLGRLGGRRPLALDASQHRLETLRFPHPVVERAVLNVDTMRRIRERPGDGPVGPAPPAWPMPAPRECAAAGAAQRGGPGADKGLCPENEEVVAALGADHAQAEQGPEAGKALDRPGRPMGAVRGLDDRPQPRGMAAVLRVDGGPCGAVAVRIGRRRRAALRDARNRKEPARLRRGECGAPGSGPRSSRPHALRMRCRWTRWGP